MDKIVHPIKYRIVERTITPEKSSWYFWKGKTFYNPLNLPTDCDLEFLYGTTKKKVVIELFRINGGKPGYYLVNLQTNEYYYCGLQWDNVKCKFRELGIGRDEAH